MSRRISRKQYASDRWMFLFAAITFAVSVIDVAVPQLGLNNFDRWFDRILFTIILVSWALLAIQRVIAVRLSWALILPAAVSYAIGIHSALNARVSSVRIALGLAVLLQIPLLFLAPRERHSLTDSELPADPTS